MMHGRGKSDSPIVPGKPPNNAGRPAAEAVEGRGGAKGNVVQSSTHQTQSWASVSQATDRIRCAARRDKRVRLTALLHHVNVDLLRFCVSPAEAPGRTGRRRPHLARVRGGSRGQPHGSAWTRTAGRLPGEAVAAAVHPQTRRPATAARHRRAGGQDRPARGGGGAERHLRDGLPRFLLRLPAGTQPAPCAGRARGRDLPAEDQLDPGCRHRQVLGDGIIMPPGSCGWAKEVGLLVYHSDTQAFPLAAADMERGQLAALDTLQHGLA